MAARINGFTVHAWGEIPWCKSSSTGNMTVQAGNSGSRDMSSMASKTEVCRWVFNHEVEALGAETLGILEENTTEASRRKGYKFRGNIADPLRLRPFGGVFLRRFVATSSCHAGEHFEQSFSHESE